MAPQRRCPSVRSILLLIVLVCVPLATRIIAAEPASYPELSQTRIAAIARWLPPQPAGFGVPCSDRAAWERVAAEYRPEIQHAATYLNSTLPAWNNEAYLQFSRTGDRQRGEAMLHRRNGQLSALVLAECSEWNGRFLARIAEELDAIAAEPSWTLPAHDANLENFHGTHYTVDLNASTMSHEVAEALYLLGDKIPQPTRERILRAMNLHVFEPFRRSIAGQKPDWWLNATNNWNAVCLDGVAGAALTLLSDTHERAVFAAAAEHYSNYYLRSFRDSGYADEGIGYWSYGFSHYTDLRDVLWSATHGRLDLFDTPKARKAALFGFQFAMLPGVYADFGDAHFMVQPDPVLLARIDTIFDLNMTQDRAKATERALRSDLLTAVLAGFPIHTGVRRPARTSQAQTMALRTYYGDVGVLVDRPVNPRQTIAITIKDGGNSNHSHNDVGSYSIGMNGTQVVGDPGGPLYYTADTFSRHRYNSALLNSFGHPVPVIAGSLQLEATKLTPKVLSTRFSSTEDSIAMDLTSAYPPTDLRHLTRTMQYSRTGAGAVEVEDRFVLPHPGEIVESFPTHGTCRQLDARTLQFDYKDAHVKLTLDGPGAFALTRDKITDYGESVTRVGVHFNMGKSGVIKMHFIPVM